MFKSNTQPSPAEIIQEKLIDGHEILPLPQVVEIAMNQAIDEFDEIKQAF